MMLDRLNLLIMNKSIFIFCSMLLLTLLSSCSRRELDQQQYKLDTPPVVVETLTLSAEPLVYAVETFGTLEVAENIAIGVESAGVVKTVHFAEGQSVEAAQLLFTLEDGKQRQRVNQAEAQVREASSELTQARDSLTRKRKLADNALISEVQLQEAETAFNSASARLNQSQAILALAKTELAERKIRCPAAGVVEFEGLEPGQYVQPGQVLARIQAAGSLQTHAYVNENEVVQLASGQRGTAYVAGFEHSAVIESVGSSANPKTGNYLVKLRLDGDQSLLREGMAAKVVLPVKQNSMALQLPLSAVVDRHRRRTVFVAIAGKAQSRVLNLGMQSQDKVLVGSGVEAGEKIILSPLDRIEDGTDIIEAEVPQKISNDGAARAEEIL